MDLALNMHYYEPVLSFDRPRYWCSERKNFEIYFVMHYLIEVSILESTSQYTRHQ